jgi:subtilisin family serine protease
MKTSLEARAAFPIGSPRLFFSGLLALILGAAAFARGQTILFAENFEGDFPGSGWSVGDFEPEGDPAFWDDVHTSFGSVPARSGSWKGYCAGAGFAGTTGSPQYQDDMFAEMYRSVSLAGATSASLTFWYNIPSIETGVDICAVFVDSTVVWSQSSSSAGWQQATIDLTAYVGGAHVIAFAFASDFSLVGEGWYLDDIVVSAGGVAQQPNLTAYRPAGWSDKIVVSRVTGTTTDTSDLQPSDTLYVDWAVVNSGSVAVNATFRTELYVDGVFRIFTSSAPPLQPNAYRFVSDYSIGTLSAGTHTLTIRADTTGAVGESDETDNEYTKTITISGTPDIRVSPLAVGFNITNSGGGLAPSEPAEAGALYLSAEQKLELAAGVSERFNAGAERVDVIVNLQSPAGKPRGREWDSKVKLEQWQGAVKSRQEEVLSGLAPGEFQLRHRFGNQSGFSGAVTRQGFEKLARHPRVESIELVRPLKAQLAQGIPLMNALVYRSTYSGAGVSVAIVDSGVDYRHPRLGGGGFPNSKVIGGYDFGDLDADPQASGSAHGTACAGIAAGDLGTTNDYIGGVAASAKIYALKITAGASGGSSSAEVIAAWDWCITHKNDDPANPILVISTSFGGERYFSACDGVQSAEATAANNAVAAGITVLAASGNDGYCDSLSSPACLSSVISVGAVYDAAYGTVTLCIDPESCAPKYFDPSCDTSFGTDSVTGADKVTPYSNIASFLGVLAPAHRAYTTDIVGAGGYSAGDYDPNFGGTSAACPYAAGAVAALQSAARTTLGRVLTPAEVRQRLVATGDPVTDTKVAITKPRINLGRAIESLGQNNSFTIFNDGNAPLTVTAITPDSAVAWLSWTPQAPFTLGAGTAQVIALSVDPSVVPAGETTRRLLIASDDPDENPYPGGVFVSVTNGLASPTLQVARVGNQILLSWPTNATGFVLRSTANLSGSGWGTVATTPVVVAGRFFVTNTISGNARFYRLQK